jgi:perosamine synthetase
VIPITKPTTGEEEAMAAAEAVRSGWLSQGERVRRFEELVASYVGARHAIATSNCTTSLHLALIAAGVGPGDEVICPSFSFIATANAIVHAGATPVFVDIEPLSYNIDPRLIEAAITPRTSAIMPVDQIGLAADLPAIRAIAQRHGLKLVEDAAPSLGATVGELRVGSLSDFSCFSFHPRKSITTGEGGVITTDDDAAADRLRALRSHGATLSDFARHDASAVVEEEYHELGYNCRMTDVQAAIGLVQMGRLDGVLAERRRLALRYTALLAGHTRIAPPHEPRDRQHTFQSYCVRLRTEKPLLQVRQEMADRGVATRRGVMAIHLQPYYRAQRPALTLPETEHATEETLLLPLYAGMSEADQDRVVAALDRVVA